MAKKIELKIGKTPHDSQVKVDGEVLPILCATIALAPGEQPILELVLAPEELEIGTTTLRGYLVDQEEYDKYQAWRRACSAPTN